MVADLLPAYMVIPDRMLARAFDETASIEASSGEAGGLK
jgi:hypothetical protein